MSESSLYPTLHALGLGPELEALERICAQSQAGKHRGEPVTSRDADHHFNKAGSHMVRSGHGYARPDVDSGEPHLIHAAARLLMAAHCVRVEREREMELARRAARLLMAVQFVRVEREDFDPSEAEAKAR